MTRSWDDAPPPAYASVPRIEEDSSPAYCDSEDSRRDFLLRPLSSPESDNCEVLQVLEGAVRETSLTHDLSEKERDGVLFDSFLNLSKPRHIFRGSPNERYRCYADFVNRANVELAGLNVIRKEEGSADCTLVMSYCDLFMMNKSKNITLSENSSDSLSLLEGSVVEPRYRLDNQQTFPDEYGSISGHDTQILMGEELMQIASMMNGASLSFKVAVNGLITRDPTSIRYVSFSTLLLLRQRALLFGESFEVVRQYEFLIRKALLLWCVSCDVARDNPSLNDLDVCKEVGRLLSEQELIECKDFVKSVTVKSIPYMSRYLELKEQFSFEKGPVSNEVHEEWNSLYASYKAPGLNEVMLRMLSASS